MFIYITIITKILLLIFAGKAANQMLNSNTKEFIDIATPVIERKVAELLLQSARNIVKNVDYDEAFPLE